MTLQYINHKGETYYLHKGTGKKGGSQYSFSKRDVGTTVKSIPEGYEIYEDPNGRAFLRKIVPKKISHEEVSVVENSIRQYSKMKDYKIDVKGKAITPIERKRKSPFLLRYCLTMVLCINLFISYLISFPLMMGEGKDGGGRPGPFPPHLNPPPLWGEELFFGSIGVLQYICRIRKSTI